MRAAEFPPSTTLITFRGEIVAVAGASRCHLVGDLDPASRWFVAVMCLCRREVDAGRLAGPFTSQLAERWARLVLIGPSASSSEDASDDELAELLGVPVDQVGLARAEFSPIGASSG